MEPSTNLTQASDKDHLEKVLAAALAKGAEFAEVYIEARTTDTVQIEEQVVREASRGVISGVGVRAVVDLLAEPHLVDDAER